MKLTWLIAMGLLAALGSGGFFLWSNQPKPAHTGAHKAPAYNPDEVTADGVLEGAHPEVGLRPELGGIIAAILHRENQEVREKELLVELRNETQKQQLALAEADVATAVAEVSVAEANVNYIKNEREEKRKSLAAQENAKSAVLQQSKTVYERSQRLSGTGAAVSGEKREMDYYRMLRDEAELDQVKAERALIDGKTLDNQVTIAQSRHIAAQAKLAAAEAHKAIAQAELNKTIITAPINGRILRVYNEPGELAGPTSAQSVLIMADLSKRRVRAFIEELDAPRIKLGQTAVITIDGIPDKEFPGTVAVLMPRMGKRTLRTDDPQEYKDLYYREVLIDLPSDEDLTPNLRVKVRIKVN